MRDVDNTQRGGPGFDGSRCHRESKRVIRRCALHPAVRSSLIPWPSFTGDQASNPTPYSSVASGMEPPDTLQTAFGLRQIGVRVADVVQGRQVNRIFGHLTGGASERAGFSGGKVPVLKHWSGASLALMFQHFPSHQSCL
jgi:hypothetical protein